MIKKFILRAFANGIAIWITDKFLGSMTIVGETTAIVLKTIIIMALVFTILNAIIKPLLKIAAFPLMFITGGLFIFAINAVIFYVSVQVLPIISPELLITTTGAKVHFIAPLIISIITWIEWLFIKPKKKTKKRRDYDKDDNNKNDNKE